MEVLISIHSRIDFEIDWQNIDTSFYNSKHLSEVHLYLLHKLSNLFYAGYFLVFIHSFIYFINCTHYYGGIYFLIHRSARIAITRKVYMVGRGQVQKEEMDLGNGSEETKTGKETKTKIKDTKANKKT